jgi:dynactin complex subunit
VKGVRYFEAGKNQGAFVRPERCEPGKWEVLGLEGSEEEM